jgi:hypothetical protein
MKNHWKMLQFHGVFQRKASLSSLIKSHSATICTAECQWSACEGNNYHTLQCSYAVLFQKKKNYFILYGDHTN